MKKRLAVLAAFLSVFALTAPASAQTSRLYFAGYLGLNMQTTGGFSEKDTTLSGDASYKNANSFAGALGLRLTPHWRLEGEISRRSFDLRHIHYSGAAGPDNVGASMRTWLYMLNVYYDFDYNWSKITPFVMAGFGLASHDGKILDPSGTMPDATGSSLGWAWSLGGGLKYRVKPNFAFTGNYRYLATSDAQIQSYSLGYGSHELRLGLEYDIPVELFR